METVEIAIKGPEGETAAGIFPLYSVTSLRFTPHRVLITRWVDAIASAPFVHDALADDTFLSVAL
jgi:hypothetical protein